MIDVHTHVFNLRYLPVEGILRSRGIPATVARGVARLLEHYTDDDDTLRELGMPFRASLGALLDHMVKRTDSSAFYDEDVLRALVELGLTAPTGEEGLMDALDGLADYLTGEPAESIAGLAGGRDWILERLWDWVRDKITDYYEAAGAAADKASEMAKGFLRFLFILTEDESTIADHLIATYGHAVALFVHHMMDMEEGYEGEDPRYDVHTRVRRMRKLGQKFNGRLLGFVAYEPRRPQPLEYIKHALVNGFCGVKVYPPNGYYPLGGPNHPDWDERLRALYAHCVDKDIPILTHSSPGGVRAAGVASENAHPARWRVVLGEFPALRLCLGHAGGDEGWFGAFQAPDDPAFVGSWAEEVAKLCEEFDNVYCDFSYLEDICTPAMKATLRERLARLFGVYGRLADKIMYGSDWHMLYKERQYREYLDDYQDVFSDAGGLAACRDRFFLKNALRFLNLEGFLARCADSLSEQERSYLEGLLPATS